MTCIVFDLQRNLRGRASVEVSLLELNLKNRGKDRNKTQKEECPGCSSQQKSREKNSTFNRGGSSEATDSDRTLNSGEKGGGVDGSEAG